MPHVQYAGRVELTSQTYKPWVLLVNTNHLTFYLHLKFSHVSTGRYDFPSCSVSLTHHKFFGQHWCCRPKGIIPPPPQKKKKIGVIIAYNHWFSLKYYTPLFHSAIIGEWGSSEKKKNKTCILIYIMVSKGKNQTKSVIYSHETPQVLSVGVMLDIMFKESHYVGHSLALVGPRGSLSEQCPQRSTAPYFSPECSTTRLLIHDFNGKTRFTAL